jgi:SAM-dependent methyltransferase
VSTARVFERIYRTNGWAGQESLSGPGSGTSATWRTAQALEELVASLGVRSVLDVGCGDGWWMPELPGYLGVDVSPTAIRRARHLHPGRRYRLLRPGEPLPEAELVVSRDAVQHLPLEQGVELLRRCIHEARATWLLASTFVGGKNVPIEAGQAYSPDLEQPPFSLGKPEQLLPDGWAYDGSDQVRDPRKFLGLWRS